MDYLIYLQQISHNIDDQTAVKTWQFAIVYLSLVVSGVFYFRMLTKRGEQFGKRIWFSPKLFVFEFLQWISSMSLAVSAFSLLNIVLLGLFAVGPRFSPAPHNAWLQLIECTIAFLAIALLVKKLLFTLEVKSPLKSTN